MKKIFLTILLVQSPVCFGMYYRHSRHQSLLTRIFNRFDQSIIRHQSVYVFGTAALIVVVPQLVAAIKNYKNDQQNSNNSLVANALAVTSNAGRIALAAAMCAKEKIENLVRAYPKTSVAVTAVGTLALKGGTAELLDARRRYRQKSKYLAD